MNKRTIGAEYEQIAAAYLEKQGYHILFRNYRCHLGEIDIVAKDGEYLVFVEVKYRRNDQMGLAEEAVTLKKQTVIRRVARYYLLEQRIGESMPCRFDVVGITGEQMNLIRNAF